MTYPEHIQWIIDNRDKALTDALSQDNSYKTVSNPLDIFLDADPTPKKKLTQWLVDTYIKDGFRWEDIQSGSNSKVFDTLSLYIKHKSKLDSDNRDLRVNANHIGQYDSLGSVYKDIAPFIKSEKSGRSVKRDEQAQAYEESEVLIKSDSLTVVIPKTEYASKWWGRGTQWCTAGDKNNMFESYYKDGPLIIIIVNGVKTQLHVDLVDKDSEVQFMDEHDNKVELNFIENNWTLLSPIIEWVMKHNSYALYCIPVDFRTEDLCLDVIKKNGRFLNWIPKYLRTLNLCLEAVKSAAISLKDVPKSLITEELCLEAVRQHGSSLVYIPEHLRTAELCLEAVKNYRDAIKHVPEHLKTAELCLEAVKNYGRALEYVPEELITAKLCLEAVKQNGYALEYVPEELITVELCLEAVGQNSWSFKYVPEHLITAELCLDAVRGNGVNLQYVPQSLRTEEMYLEAVKQNGNVLAFVPESLRTLELCLKAVKNNGGALYYIPKLLRTPELYLEAVKQDGRALELIPEYFRTSEIYLESKKQISSLCYLTENSNVEIWNLKSIIHNFKESMDKKSMDKKLLDKPHKEIYLFL